MKKLGKVVMCVLLAVSIGLSAVCIGLVRKLLADETEPVAVQCNGTAIQWRLPTSPDPPGKPG